MIGVVPGPAMRSSGGTRPGLRPPPARGRWSAIRARRRPRGPWRRRRGRTVRPGESDWDQPMAGPPYRMPLAQRLSSSRRAGHRGTASRHRDRRRCPRACARAPTPRRTAGPRWACESTRRPRPAEEAGSAAPCRFPGRRTRARACRATAALRRCASTGSTWSGRVTKDPARLGAVSFHASQRGRTSAGQGRSAPPPTTCGERGPGAFEGAAGVMVIE